MLAKWLWRFATKRDSWWRKLIDIKYHNPSSVWQTEMGMVLSSAFPRVAADAVDFEARLSDVASLNGELGEAWLHELLLIC
ncbi:unnamed protein product [Linum trigynum]|uniref:Reverse transcriptase zinc-binding domain-containing protein n=1 Tax=Linum trigynum TaxID=586398 RepID=A0AAV2E2H9_9ROSI